MMVTVGILIIKCVIIAERNGKMESPIFKHNMQSLITGEIEYSTPFEYTFVYDDNRRHTFNDIMRMSVMRTGCYVLFDSKGTAFVIRPLFDYVIEKPENE